jgi:hypothetical protein
MLCLRPPAPFYVVEAPPAASASSAALNPYGSVLVDLRSRATQVSFAQNFAVEADLELLPPQPTVIAEAEDVRAAATPEVSYVDDGTPLPPRRPAEYGSSARRSPSQAPARQIAEQDAKSVAPSDNRTLFEKFFGASSQPSGPQSRRTALAYAAPETNVIDAVKGIVSSPTSRYDQWTAVYDISAHTVYLPNGTKLEAHSGLGSRLDDPRYVHERMRGATPPNVYELEPREKLFHGVQALRLKPVGGGNVFGRAGLLAHTYMLGPKGDSNGCVVFRNYNAFLQAFQNGEIKRLAVVARLD